MEVICQIHAPGALPPRKEPPLLDRRLRGPQSQSAHWGEENNVLHQAGIFSKLRYTPDYQHPHLRGKQLRLIIVWRMLFPAHLINI
jgi:hypothetical protein